MTGKFLSLMKPERFKKIEEIYQQVLEIAADKHASFLQKVCAGDVQLQKEIESLLAYEKSSDNFIDSTPEALIAELVYENDSENLTGKTIGQYKILSLLGKGGMGAVYLALDEKLLRKAALKILSPKMVADENRVGRFIHEARAASALNHPNILTIYNIGEWENLHFIAAEFVSGETLLDKLNHQNCDLKELLGYLIQTADGLAKAHSKGIIHRDLKPENIMVSNDGYAKILDFGLAKLVESKTGLEKFQSHKSAQGVILGTLGYMSPEQAEGKAEITASSDIFSFGCILYEAITGRKPFSGESTIDTLYKISHSDFAPLTDFNKSVSPELQDIVGRCLKKDPHERTQNITKVGEKLREIISDSSGKAANFLKVGDQRTRFLREGAATGVMSQSISRQRRQTSVLFADFSVLTELLEDFDPEVAGEILTNLQARLESRIEAGGGRIDKRSSDVFTAVWGAEASRENDPERAIRAALELQTEVRKFIEETEFFRNNSAIQRSATGVYDFLKIGISTGMILLDVSSDSGEFLTTGAAVNQAKRSCRNAPIGSVLISHDTYRHVRGIFDVEPFESERHAAFKTEKMPKIYLVKRAKPRAFRLRIGNIEDIETKFVGRTGEVERILDGLFTVLEDETMEVLTVVGEAGLGKSRLLFEIHDKIELLAEKFRVLNARADETMRGSPFSLVRDVFLFGFEIKETDSHSAAREKLAAGLRNLTTRSAGEFGGEVQMKAHFIGQLIGFDFSDSPHIKSVLSDPPQIRERAEQYITQFFEALAEEFPLVLYLDDLHWADDESFEFFERLIKTRPKARMLILNFARPLLFERKPHWGEGLEHHGRLDLQPLTKRESRRLIKNILQKVKKIPENLRNLIVKNAVGNPFYLEELIKMFIERKAIIKGADEWTINEDRLGEMTVPPTLSGVLQSRLDRLAEWEKIILQRASVIGREFWDSALESFGTEQNADVILESLRRKELIYRHETSAFDDSTQYVFKHALLRDAAYDTVLLKERRILHQKTAEWLIETCGERVREHSAAIASHFEKAQNFEKAAEWFGRAGEDAENAHAPAEAVIYFRKALKFLETVEKTDKAEERRKILKWQYGLGEALRLQANFGEAVRVFKSAIEKAEKAGKNLETAKVYFGLSVAQFEQGDSLSSLESARQAVKSVGAEKTNKAAWQILADALFRQARAFYELGKFMKAIEFGKKSLGVTDRLGEKGAFVRVHSLHIIGFSYLPLGNFKHALHYQNLSLELARESGNKRNIAYALSNMGAIYNTRGDSAAAIEYFAESLPLMYEIGNKSGQIVIHGNYAGALIELGRFDAAKKHLDESIELTSDSGHFIFSENYQNLARYFLAKNRADDALEAAKISLNRAEETKSPEAVGTAWRVLGNIASHLQKSINCKNEKFSAAQCFRKSLQEFSENKMEIEAARTLQCYAQHEFEYGNKNRAEQLAKQAGTIFDRLKMKVKTDFSDSIKIC